MSDNVGVTQCIQCNVHIPRGAQGLHVARDASSPHYYKLFFDNVPEGANDPLLGHDEYFCAAWFEKLFNFKMEPGDAPVHVELQMVRK